MIPSPRRAPVIAPSLAWAALASGPAWAQANLYVLDATVGIEDVPGGDLDQNDVALRYNRRCRVDASGRLTDETLRVTGLSAGATLTNDLRLVLPGAADSVTLRHGGAPSSPAYDGLGRLVLWDDFRTAFEPAVGFVNTNGGPVVAAIPLEVTLTYASPGPAVGGACPPAEFVLVRDDDGTSIGPLSTAGDGHPLYGQFPGVWAVPRERRPIWEAYPDFLAWLDDVVDGCAGACAHDDWYAWPDLPDVVVRDDLPTTAPLAPVETCDDGEQNQDEAGTDCGGAICPACLPAGGNADEYFYGTQRQYPDSVVFRVGDENGDGDALDPGEVVPLYTFAGNTGLGSAVSDADGAIYASDYAGVVYRLFDADGDGQIEASEAVAYSAPGALQNPQDLDIGQDGSLYVGDYGTGVHRMRDLNGDGDAHDAGEDVIFSTAWCLKLDVSWDAALGRDIVWTNFYGLTRSEDLNADGDAKDTNENIYYGGFTPPGCSGGNDLGVARNPVTGLVHGQARGGGCGDYVVRYTDGNGDRDAQDAGEQALLGTYSVANSVSITFTADGDLLATSTDSTTSVWRLTDTNGDQAFEKTPWASGIDSLSSLHAGPFAP